MTFTCGAKKREMQPVTIDREMFLETASGLIESMYR